MAQPLLCRGVHDIEAHVLERIVVVSHVWPSISPFNVWDLSLGMWMRFAHAADKWVADSSKSQQEG